MLSGVEPPTNPLVATQYCQPTQLESKPAFLALGIGYASES